MQTHGHDGLQEYICVLCCHDDLLAVTARHFIRVAGRSL